MLILTINLKVDNNLRIVIRVYNNFLRFMNTAITQCLFSQMQYADHYLIRM